MERRGAAGRSQSRAGGLRGRREEGRLSRPGGSWDPEPWHEEDQAGTARQMRAGGLLQGPGGRWDPRKARFRWAVRTLSQAQTECFAHMIPFNNPSRAPRGCQAPILQMRSLRLGD